MKEPGVLRFIEAVGFCFMLACEHFIFAKQMLHFSSVLFTFCKNYGIIQLIDKLEFDEGV